MLSKTPKTKIIDGKEYTIAAEGVTKTWAKRAANDERGVGKHASVVELGKHAGRMFYGIYSRKADSDIETQKIIDKRFAILKRTAFRCQKR